jgi:hypothetical protein
LDGGVHRCNGYNTPHIIYSSRVLLLRAFSTAEACMHRPRSQMGTAATATSSTAAPCPALAQEYQLVSVTTTIRGSVIPCCHQRRGRHYTHQCAMVHLCHLCWDPLPWEDASTHPPHPCYHHRPPVPRGQGPHAAHSLCSGVSIGCVDKHQDSAIPWCRHRREHYTSTHCCDHGPCEGCPVWRSSM